MSETLEPHAVFEFACKLVRTAYDIRIKARGSLGLLLIKPIEEEVFKMLNSEQQAALPYAYRIRVFTTKWGPRLFLTAWSK